MEFKAKTISHQLILSNFYTVKFNRLLPLFKISSKVLRKNIKHLHNQISTFLGITVFPMLPSEVKDMDSNSEAIGMAFQHSGPQ